MRVVHRYWTGPPHPLASFTHNVAASVADRVVEWDDQNLPGGCLEECKRAEGTVRPEDAVRHRSNVVRWWLLAEYGGWWSHHDLILLKPLAELPYPVTAAHRAARCTCFLGFPPGHPIPLAMLEGIRKAPRNSSAWSRHVSGEERLTGMARRLPALLLPFDKQGNRVGDGSPWAILLRYPKSADGSVGRNAGCRSCGH